MTTTTKRTFEQWKAAVNAAVESLAGLSADDLADQPYMDWYEDGMSPGEAAREALTEEGFYDE